MKNFLLVRYEFCEKGIFGVLLSKDFKCETLEHAYQKDNTFVPKVPEGEYLCRKGMHRLLGMDRDFETFEIENVPEHTNILFHSGNTNADSEGCVLLGAVRAGDAVAVSRGTFQALMSFLGSDEEFNLKVIDMAPEAKKEI